MHPSIPVAALTCLAVCVAAPPAAARVDTQGQTGFSIVHEAVLEQPPAAVWEALLHPERWWNQDHSWSGDRRNLTLEPKAGGCFCERWEDGSAEHLRVVSVLDGRELRFSGGLGPLGREGLAGAMAWVVTPEGAGTKVTWTYVVGGHTAAMPVAEWAPLVDQVIGLQFAALGSHVAGQ